MGESWRLYHGKKQRPKNSMRIIRTIAEDGWRPVAAPTLPIDTETLAAEIAQLVIVGSFKCSVEFNLEVMREREI